MIDVGMMRRAHRQFSKELNRVVDSAAQASAEYTEANAKQRIQPHNRTGRLLNATKGRVIRLPGERRVRLENFAMSRGVGYASYVDQGNGTGYIYPRTARALRFRIGPLFIFAKRVRAYQGSFLFTKARRAGFLFAGDLLRTKLAALAQTF